MEGRRSLPSPCVPFVHCLASVVTSFPPRPPISSSPVRTTGGAGRSPGRSDGDEMGGMRKGWGAGHEWRVTRGAGRDMKTEGPFMKRDVKGSVTGPTSVSMSLTLRHEPSTLLTHAVRLSCLPSLA